ncbi:MAG: YncE family protein [Bryobacteraceae bacterium]
MKLFGIGLFATRMVTLLSTYGVAVGAPAAGYHLIKTVHSQAAPGGKEYFDYITFDAPSRRVYAAHGAEVIVFDADNYTVVGKISGLHRCHGVVLVPDLGKGFITDGDADTGKVVMFDIAKLKVIGEIKGEPDADGIVYDPASKRVFAFNGDSENSTVIDAAKGTVLATLPLGGKPEQAVADNKGMIYDNLEDKNEVIAIDARELKIKGRWPVAPLEEPVAMAMDRQHRRLFIGGRGNKMLVVMNADTGKIIGQPFPIGDVVDANIYDPGTGFVASSTREGTINIVHEDSPDTFSPVENVKTQYGAKTMAVDPKTHNIWVDTADFGAPPAPTAKRPNPPPAAIPGTYRMLVYAH